MKYIRFLLIVLIFAGPAPGQISKSTPQADRPLVFSGKLNPYPERLSKDNSPDADQTVKIFAVMVEFQEDSDALTFGNGKFGSLYTGDNATSKEIIDPLPHDAEYFRQHLQFAQNYFNEVSYGKVDITWEVPDRIFTVSELMREYSPDPGSDDLTPVGTLAQEVWQMVESELSGSYNLSDYNLFTIFHAGAGRDVSLPGSFGNERDIPSVYLSLRALRVMFGDSFDGFASGVIQNTMILPCTESRELSSVAGKTLLELSINGLIVSSIGSYLGLPDLFNTETGLSTIGRFGLMDGQAIFTYGGLFPPEPSPWEKMYLGWIEPYTIDPGDYLISLSAVEAAAPSDTTLIKVPISATEYYLIENRARDTQNDGAYITYMLDGTEYSMNLTEDTTGFRSYDIDTLKGVITDVDEFDWAVPGSGIVIWHIDEKVIAENIDSNTVNNDNDRKGIDVEEADGIQDIGEEFVTIFGDVIIGEGDEEDLWYSSNAADLYTNRFAYDTKPDSRSNSGGNSQITIENFSDISNKMTFSLSFGDDNIRLSIQKKLSDKDLFGLNSISLGDRTLHFGCNGSRFFVIDEDGSIIPGEGGVSAFRPASLIQDGRLLVSGAKDNTISFYIFDGTAHTSFEKITTQSFSSAPVMIAGVGSKAYTALGTSDGKVLLYELDADNNDASLINTYDIFNQTEVKDIALSGSPGSIFAGAISENSYGDISGNMYNADGKITDVALIDRNGTYRALILVEPYNFVLIENGQKVREFTANPVDTVKSFSVVKFESDGEPYIIYSAASHSGVLNMSGAVGDNFPFVSEESEIFSYSPASADVDGDAIPDLIFTTENGKIYAVSGEDGNNLSGFPVAGGNELTGTPSIHYDNGLYITALDQDSVLYSWEIKTGSDNIQWSGSEPNDNNPLVEVAGGSSSGMPYFPEELAYNWPNPVYEGETYIRFYVAEDSKAIIHIFDLAGALVAEMNVNALGGINNEIAWDITGIQSGVYFAHLEVTGALSGNSGYKIIKIAVVK